MRNRRPFFFGVAVAIAALLIGAFTAPAQPSAQVRYVETLGAATNRTPTPGMQLWVGGRFMAGDWGPPRLMRWDSSGTNTIDGGCVFPVDGTGNLVADDCGGGLINVRWFGAKGDGVTDDSVAVYAARSAASNRTAAVFFPAGSYAILSDGLTVQGPRLEPRGFSPSINGSLSLSNLVASNSVVATTVSASNVTASGTAAAPTVQTTNLTVAGAISFGGETRTTWPTNGGGGGGGGISLVGVKGDLIYHDGTNWTKLADTGLNGRVVASLNGLPVWANFDSGDLNFLTEAAPFTNITTSARNSLSLSTGNKGHTVFDTDLKALMMWSGTNWVGFPIGVPWAPARAETRLALVCGALRQNTTNRAIWNYITNSTHNPQGFGGDFAIANSNTLTLTFGRTFTRPIAFLAYADETFGGGSAVSFGARVTTSNAVISAGSSYAGSWVLRYTGASWSVTSVSGSDVQPSVSGYTNGVLRVAHDYMRGRNVFVSAWSNSGGNYGYIPALRDAGDSYVDIEWIDPTTGQIVTSASPLWRMTAAITRRHFGPLDLDGSHSSDSLLGEDTSVGGNIWVIGLFEY